MNIVLDDSDDGLCAFIVDSTEIEDPVQYLHASDDVNVVGGPRVC